MAARSQAAAGGTAAAAAGRHHELAALKQHFPGREQAIDQLAAELCRSGSLGTNLLVYGPPATGKTAVVRCAEGWGRDGQGGQEAGLQSGGPASRSWAAAAAPFPASATPTRTPPPSYPPPTCLSRALLRTLQVRHAYVNCNEAARARPLLASVLHQLKGGKRQRDECYDAGVKCDGIADFRLQLPGVLMGVSTGGACALWWIWQW